MTDNNQANNKRIRVALYARVSTEEQAEHGYSIEGQRDTISQYCKIYGKDVIGEYIDKGISGKAMSNRPALQNLLRDAERGSFDEVIVWKFNRMSRKTKDLLEIVERLDKHNVYFRSISESFDTSTPIGKFALQMMGAVGELERNTIVENVKMGLKQRARTGLHNGGICLGYRSVEIAGGERKNKKTCLEIVPEEAAVVIKIFEAYDGGRGFRSIANQLNREGHRTKKGNTFSSDSIREIVTNPIYVGMVRYNRFEGWSEKRRRGKNPHPIMTEGRHEAIISQQLWDKVQMLFSERSKACPRVYDSENLLTGLIHCPECGTPMVISRSHYKLKDGSRITKRYYSCGAFKTKGSSVCHANSIGAEYAEKYVLSRIKTVLTHPRMLNDVVKAVNKKRASSARNYGNELSAVEADLERLEEKKSKLLDVYELDGIDKETLSGRLMELAEETDRLHERKVQLEQDSKGITAPPVSLELVRGLLERLNGAVEKAPPEQKKALLHLAIDEITLMEGRKTDKIILLLDDELKKTFLQEDPSANAADGSSSFNGTHKKGMRISIAI